MIPLELLLFLLLDRFREVRASSVTMNLLHCLLVAVLVLSPNPGNFADAGSRRRRSKGESFCTTHLPDVSSLGAQDRASYKSCILPQ